MEQITQFPNLYHTAHPLSQDSQDIQFEFKLRASATGIVVKSWGLLLHRFTKQQDTVSFYLDGDIVEFDSSTWSSDSKPHDNLKAGAQGTGIKFTAEKSTQAFKNGLSNGHYESEKNGSDDNQKGLLLLEYDATLETAILHNPGFVPQDFLPEFSKQLCVLAKWVEDSREKPSIRTSLQNDESLLSLSILNEKPQIAQGPQLLHELISPALLSQNSGSADAIEHLDSQGGRTKLSYADLNEKSDRLAAKITRVFKLEPKNSPAKIIPLLIPQCPSLYIAMLATLKAGCAFCPLNLDTPSERIRFVANDVSASTVLTLSSLEGSFSNIEGISLCFADDDIPEQNLLENGYYLRKPEPSDLAYVMYTSGSTGQPKGVGLSHMAVTQSLLAHDAYIPPFQRFLQFAAPTFDVSQFEIFFTFYKGSTLISCDRRKLLNDLPGVIRDMQIDGAELTPTVAGSLLISRQNAPELSVLLTIGEMLTRQVVQEFGGTDLNKSMLQGMYGPTEAAIHCTLQPNFQADLKVGIVGIPFSTVSAFVVKPAESKDASADLDILPVGQIGELAVGGHQLAVGYLNRPEQTQTVFIDHPLYGRVYRTGDKARILPSGLIECLGRISTGQVKLRGQRIELGEIEQVAMKTDECLLATASVLQSNLVLFCQAREGVDALSPIQKMCEQWLPPYMIPNDIVIMNSLPRLPSGKIDKKTLDAQYIEKQQAQPDETIDIQDDSIVEDILTTARETLDINLHSKSNLSRSGIESLSAIRFASALRERGYNVSAIDILNADSPETLSSHIHNTQSADETSTADFSTYKKTLFNEALSAPEMRDLKAQIDRVVPCTPLQVSMLAETMLRKTRYCNIIELELTGRISFSTFKSDFARIAQYNAMLRSGFLQQNNSKVPFVRVIWKQLRDSQVRSVTELDHAYSVSHEDEYLRPLQVDVLETKNGLRILLKLHHALYDGWSFDLIHKDLQDALQGKEIPERPSFESVNRFHFDKADTPTPSAAESFWKDHMKDFPSMETLTTNKSLHDHVAVTDRTVPFSVSDVRRQLGQNFHPQSLFQASLLIAQHQLNQSSDHVIGVVTNGRTVPVAGIEHIVGPFIATLPLRVRFESDQTGTGILMKTQRLNRRLLEHSRVSLSEIKQLCGIDPGTRLFNVLMVWQESLTSDLLDPNVIRKIHETNVLETPLFIELEPLRNKIHMRASYLSHHLDRKTVDLILKQTEDIARALLENPRTLIQDLSLTVSNIPEKSNPLHLEPCTQTHYSNGDTSSRSKLNGFSPEIAQDEQKLDELKNGLITALSDSTDISVFDIEPHTKFFSYGLNSISAIFMSKKIQEYCRISIDISEIFAHPTVLDLATYLRKQQARSKDFSKEMPTLDPNALQDIKKLFHKSDIHISTIRPCTPLQEGMLSAEQLSSENSYFNNTVLNIYGDTSTVLESFEIMIARHEILRTCFASSTDPRFGFAQVVLQRSSPSITKLDIRSEDMTDSISREMTNITSAIDSMVPPWRLILFQAAENTKLLVQMHHALYDGEAISRLFEELELKYKAQPLPSLIDYDEFLKQSLSLDLKASDNYWDRILDGYSPTSFPQRTAIKSSENMAHSSKTSSISVSFQTLQDFCQDQSATLLAVLQSAWVKVVLTFLGEEDVCFGNVVSGRTIALDGLDHLVAPCFNTIPVRAKISSKTTNSRLMSQLQERNVSALPYQFTPLRRIQKRQSQSGEQLFDNLFILQQPQRKLDETIWSLDQDVGFMGYPLVCEVIPDPDRDALNLTIHFSQPFLSASHVDGILQAYRFALESCVLRPQDSWLDFKLSPIFRTMESLYCGIGNSYQHIDIKRLKSLPDKENVACEALVATFPGRSAGEAQQYIFAQPHKERNPAKTDEYYQDSILTSLQLNDSGIHVVIVDELPQSGLGIPRRRILQRIAGLDLRGFQEGDEDKNASTSSSDEAAKIRLAFSTFSSFPEEKITTQTIFQLGLDSINAIQIANYLRGQGYQINADDILSHPTVPDLALVLGQRRTGGELVGDTANISHTSLSPTVYNELLQSLDISPESLQKLLPCAPVQAGIIAESLRTTGAVYINHTVLETSKSLNIPKLREAWEIAAQRHDILRTGFTSTDNAETPFIMLCYKEIDMTRHFQEVENVSEDLDNLIRIRSEIASGIFNVLHTPAWKVTVGANSGKAVVQFSGHHALFDAESLNILLNDVCSIYLGRHLPAPQPIEPALSHILQTATDEDGLHAQFWKEQLEDVSITRFPNLLPLRKQGREVGTKVLTLSSQLDELQKACRNLNVTIQALLQASWAKILSLYTGEDEVMFGVVLSGRDIDVTTNVNFPCAVTLPCRLSVAENKKQIFADAMKFGSSVRKHQHFPLTNIQRAAGIDKMALFDTLLVLQRSVVDDNGEDDFWHIVDEAATVEYSLSMEVQPQETGDVKLQLVYWDDVLPEKQADVLLHQFDTIIHQTIYDLDENSFPNELLSYLPPKQAILPIDGNLLHEVFERSAECHGAAISLEFWPDLDEVRSPSKWTYSQVQVLGNQYANFLLASGCRSGSVVATCFEKCPEAYFVTLGILKAGCAFLAIDHSAPTDRKSFILEDSGAVALITSRSWAQELAGQIKIPVHCIEDIAPSEHESTRPDVSVTPESTSYCLYTSGSTGTPKGCIISHRNVVQFLAFFHLVFANRWDDTSRMMQFASFHFDVSVMEQFFSWSIGITLVSTPRDALLEDLAGGLDRLKITHIDLTPSLARLITPDEVPSLCRGNFITGGEALNQEVLNNWASKEVIHNGYGPTEATIGCTMYPRVPENGKPSNIGWQYDNAGIYVLRPGTDQGVPRGAVGELCISGVLVSQGYINRPDLNEEKFPTLFGERMYRTGDLVRMLHNESLDFAGRIDDQVKLRGQRLELGEINATITELTNVDDAATLVVVSGDSQSKQLISFVAPENGSISEDLHVQADQDQAKSVLETCRNRLPGYMVPSRAIIVNKIPLTSNHKVDFKSLRILFAKTHLPGCSTANDKHDTVSSASYPSTDAERNVLAAMENFVSAAPDSLSAETSPFQAGIDSISVFAFVRVLKSLGFEKARTQVVLQSDTVRDLVKALSDTSEAESHNVSAAKQSLRAVQQRFRGKVAKTLKVNTDAVQHIAPCTPLQQGIIARSFEGSTRQYFNQFVFELSPQVKISELNEAWRRIIRSVPILKTYFVPTDDGYVQAYVPSMPSDMCSLCVSAKSIEKDLESHRQFWISQNQEAFHLPFQVLLLQTKQRSLMVLHLFHSLYDAMSLELLLHNLAEEYSGNSPLYGPSFFDVLPYGPLCKQNDATIFWTKHLSSAHLTPVVKSPEKSGFKTCSASLEGLEWDGLQELCQELNVTQQAIVQTCWMAVLQEKLGAPTTIGTIVSGRSLDVADAENVIGPLFNTLPLWLAFRDGETWKDAIQRSHQHNIASLPYHHTPLRDISKVLKKSPLEPLFDTLFVLQRQQSGQKSGQHLWKEVEGPVQADYPLSFEMTESRNGSYVCNLVAQSFAASDEDCSALLKRFNEVMTVVVQDCETSIPQIVQVRPMKQVTGNGQQRSSVLQKKTGSHGKTANETLTEILIKEVSTLAEIDSQSVTAETSIFELGLDSIDAIKLSSRLKRKGFQLTVSKIMQNHFIADMSEYCLGQASSSEQWNRATKLDELKHVLAKELQNQGLQIEAFENILPATPLQEALVAEMKTTDFKNYLNHDVLEISPQVDLEQLLRAWEDVIRQNPILRTSFMEAQDPSLDLSYGQLVHTYQPQIIHQHELRPGDSFDIYFEQIRQHFSSAGQNEVPLRLAVLRRGSSRYLALTMAHALYDGWSQNLLHQDIARSYRHESVPRPSYEPMLSTIIDSSSDESESFWKDTITGSPGCEFPIRGETDNSGVFRERASSCALKDIQSFCKLTNVTLQALGQFCWSAVLASFVKNLDITFGVVLSGRDDEQVQELMFPTMNTVAIRILLHDSRKDMLQYVQSNLADVMQHQHFPLRKVQQMAKRKLFNTLFIYQRKPQAETKSEKLYTSVTEASDLGYPLCAEMEIVDGQLIWRMMCKDVALPASEAEVLIERLDNVLKTIMRNPDEAVIEFSKSGTSVCELPPFQVGNENDEQKLLVSQAKGNNSPVAQSEEQRAIVAALATVSTVPEADIRLDQTILHLGLDSVSAIKVSAVLRKRGLRLPVSAMMRAQSIGEIADMVKNSSQLSGHHSGVNVAGSTQLLAETLKSINVTNILSANGIANQQVAKVLPATAVQTMFVSMWQTSSGSIFYPSFKFNLEGAFSDQRLRAAWDRLVDENSILRTVLLSTGSITEPIIQVILTKSPESSLSFGNASEPRLGHLPACMMELNVQRFENSTLLTFHIHHALYDAVSHPQFLSRFQELLNNTSTADQPGTSLFEDFIALSRNKQAKEEQESFWRSYLSNISQLRLPREKTTQLIHRTAHYTPSAIPSVSSIEKRLQKAGLSVQSLFFASVAKAFLRQTLSSQSKDGDVVLGVYLSNRALTLPGIETLNAPTLNIVPLRLTSVRSTKLTDLAKQAQDGINKISSEPHALTSLWQITKWTGVVVDVFVNFLRLPEGESNFSFGSATDQVRITEVPEGHRGTPEVPEDMQNFIEPKELKDNPVKDYYPPTVDIEAAVRARHGERVLDIGVFGPRAIVEQEAAENWLEGIRNELNTFSS